MDRVLTQRLIALAIALSPGAAWTPLSAQDAQSLPPEAQALQKKAVEARMEAQVLEQDLARAQVKAAEAELALSEAVARYAKDLADKDKKAKEWAKQMQKTLTIARQNLEAAKQHLDLILHPPPDANAAIPGLPQPSGPDQKPGGRPPKMEDAGNQGEQR